MIETASVQVDGTANAEEKATILRGRPDVTRVVEKILVTETTSQQDGVIGVWINNTRVHDIPYRQLLEQDGSAARYGEPAIPLDVELSSEDDLQVGHKSQGTASNFDYTAVYKEE